MIEAAEAAAALGARRARSRGQGRAPAPGADRPPAADRERRGAQLLGDLRRDAPSHAPCRSIAHPGGARRCARQTREAPRRTCTRMPVRRRRADNGRWLLDFRVGGRTPPRDARRRARPPRQARRRRPWNAPGERRSKPDQIRGPETWGSLAARYWLTHARHLAWHGSVAGHLERAVSDLIGDHTPAAKVTADVLAAGRRRLAPAAGGARPSIGRLSIARGLWTMAREVWGLAAAAAAVAPAACCRSRTGRRPTSRRPSARPSCATRCRARRARRCGSRSRPAGAARAC